MKILVEKPRVLNQITQAIQRFFKEKLDGEKQESDEQQDMPELESEESAVERRNQQRQGLKILTPDQMLSRLPIPLAQLKAGNDSQKLINKIRQLLYSLYRSKKNN